MGLQGYIGFGIKASALLGFEGLRALFWLVVFLALFFLLGRAWCGWVCPFGLLSDWLTIIRKKLGIAGLKLSQKTRKRLSPIKYILLAYLIIGPVLINMGLMHPDFYLPFCRICPGKSLLPLFVGDTQYLALDMTNSVTISLSAILVGVSGLMLAGMFVRERFFCLFCPMLAIFHILKPLAGLKLIKEPSLCHGCASCHRVCPMDIEEVWKSRQERKVQQDDCLGCGDCVSQCASESCLKISFLGKKLAGSKALAARSQRSGR
jgi:polyferredoxin